MNGLRPNIQAELHQLESVRLLGKMRATQKIEKNHLALEVCHTDLFLQWPKQPMSGPLMGQQTTLVTTLPSTPRAVRPFPSIVYAPPHPTTSTVGPTSFALSCLFTPPIKRLTDREMQVKN